MKTPDWKNCSEEDVWLFVAWHLAKNGIDTVLVGGAVAAIYSEGAYKSGDLDLVLKTYVEGKIPSVMKEIGFQCSQGRHYIHPDCDKLAPSVLVTIFKLCQMNEKWKGKSCIFTLLQIVLEIVLLLTSILKLVNV